jgi:hypothetical protein
MINYRRRVREVYRSACQNRIREFIILAEPRPKKTADESGNPRIWTAEECSQEFLRSLIPSSSKQKAVGAYCHTPVQEEKNETRRRIHPGCS